MTREQALALAAARLRLQEQGTTRTKSDIIQQEALDPITQQALDPAGQMTGGQRFLAGVGRGMDQIIQGGKQMIGMGPSPQEVEEQRDRDVSLMASPEGFAGNIVGGAATTLPAVVVPGANTLAGASVLSGAYGALQPVGEGESRALNTAVGAGVGAATKLGADKLLVPAVNKAIGKVGQIATKKSQNAVRDATLKEAQKAGYVVPPSAVKPSFVGNRLEGIAGKAAIGQEAAYRNQQVTNTLARRALGLSDDVPLSETTLEGIRQQAGQVYKQVASLSPRAASALEQLKQTRHEANAYWQHYNRSADPASLKLARSLSQKVEQFERVIDKTAKQSGRQELVKALKEARTLIAKTYDVEKALNVGTGDISAPALGRAIDKGKPLTGELATIAKFQQAFSPYAREGAKLPTPGVSKSEGISSALLGILGYSAGGPPGALAATLPLMSSPVRSGLLSRPVQGLLAQPSYSVPLSTRALAGSGRYLPHIAPSLPPAAALVGVGNFPE